MTRKTDDHSNLRDSLHSGAAALGWVLLAAAALAIMLALAVFGRVLAAGVIALAIVAAPLALIFSRRARAAFLPETAVAEHHHGLRVPHDVLLTERHTWVRPSGKLAFVGLDDLVQRVLGPVDHVSLPPLGEEVKAGDVLFTVRRGDRRLDVRSPFSGRIFHRNRGLVRHPAAMSSSPYEDGWVVALEVPELEQAQRPLRRDAGAARWFRDEVDRLLHAVCPAGPMPAMPDGGLLSPDFHELVDTETWQKLQREFFGAEG